MCFSHNIISMIWWKSIKWHLIVYNILIWLLSSPCLPQKKFDIWPFILTYTFPEALHVNATFTHPSNAPAPFCPMYIMTHSHMYPMVTTAMYDNPLLVPKYLGGYRDITLKNIEMLYFSSIFWHFPPNVNIYNHSNLHSPYTYIPNLPSHYILRAQTDRWYYTWVIPQNVVMSTC